MSLELDQRQRAMLQEMHLRVWLPQPGTPAAASATVVQGALAPVTRVSPGKRQQVDATVVARAGALDGGPDALVAAVAEMDWPALASTVAGCTACRLCDGRKRAVFGAQAAPRQADWLVLGEPPDEHEERAGVPFTGQPGQLLDNMLRAVQLSRDGVGSAGAWLSNVVKCRPAVVRIPRTDELARCAVYLRRELALVQPKVILAMGRFAALSLLGPGNPALAGVPFGKLRGQAYQYHGVPVVVTYHPTTLLRAPLEKAGAWADLCRAQSLAREPIA